MEYGNRIIKCKNADGEEITLTERSLDPFILAKAEGIYDVNNNIYSTDNTIIDGAEYQGSVMKSRNIILTLIDEGEFDENREIIDRVFAKNTLGVLTVEDGSHIRSIEFYVESVTSTADPKWRYTTVSLICPDPYFYDPETTEVQIRELMPDFEFIHEFTEEKEIFGHFNENRFSIIENESADTIGFTLSLRALGTVVNPKITKIETNEFIKVGTTEKPFTMSYGDVLTVITVMGKKNVYVNGVLANEYLTETSRFFQLARGTNTIGFSAASGTDYISIKIMYRYRYLRA